MSDEPVRTGYKKTEVGVIPEDWKLCSFSELLDFQNGVNADKRAYGRGIPFINVLEVITKTHLYQTDIPGRVVLSKSAINVFAVRRGDVLFNRTSETQDEVGLSAVYLDEKPVVFGGFVIRGRPINSSVDPMYSGYAFRSPLIRSQIIARGQGAIRSNIGQADLRQVIVPVPCLSEQRAIAEALSDVDALLDALDRLIGKKRAIKHGVMQALLTGRVRLPGFTGEWQRKTLGDVAEMRSGGTPATSVAAYYGGNIPWVSISDMTRTGKVIYETERNLSPAGLANSAAQIFPAGTIMYAMYASIGECSIAGVDLSSSQAILGIRPGNDLNNEYLYYYLSFIKSKVRSLGQQGTQANLNAEMVRAFELQLPTLSEQLAVAEALSDMDAEIDALEKRRAKLLDIKQGMMQALLTGRIRLVQPQEQAQEAHV